MKFFIANCLLLSLSFGLFLSLQSASADLLPQPVPSWESSEGSEFEPNAKPANFIDLFIDLVKLRHIFVGVLVFVIIIISFRLLSEIKNDNDSD